MEFKFKYPAAQGTLMWRYQTTWKNFKRGTAAQWEVRCADALERELEYDFPIGPLPYLGCPRELQLPSEAGREHNLQKEFGYYGKLGPYPEKMGNASTLELPGPLGREHNLLVELFYRMPCGPRMAKVRVRAEAPMLRHDMQVEFDLGEYYGGCDRMRGSVHTRWLCGPGVRGKFKDSADKYPVLVRAMQPIIDQLADPEDVVDVTFQIGRVGTTGVWRGVATVWESSTETEAVWEYQDEDETWHSMEPPAKRARREEPTSDPE